MAAFLTIKLHISLLSFWASLVLANAEAAGRISGNNTVGIYSAPYLVSLRYKHNASAPFVHRCTGTIYSPNIVLTTARCVVGMEPRHVEVIAGCSFRTQSDGYVYLVNSIVIHPDFNIFYIDNDLALLRLEFSLVTNKPKLIKSINLAEAVPAGGVAATVAVWGAAQQELLHETGVQLLDDAQCDAVYSGGRITAAMFCAVRANGTSSVVDSCQGDAGSALVSNGAAVGLVSWASFCGREGHPGVYTNLVHLKPWVESVAWAN